MAQRATEVGRRWRAAALFWRLGNPVVLRLAPLAPWWVVLETKGRRSGLPRRTPLARGPDHDGAHWVMAVRGRDAAWVRNIEACPQVRLGHRNRWVDGSAAVVEPDPAVVRRCNRYARSGLRWSGPEARLVRIDPTPKEGTDAR